MIEEALKRDLNCKFIAKEILNFKKSISDLGTDTEPQLAREERIVILPNPETADADDDFGFTTTITNFADSKTYNQTTDSDE